MSRILLYTYKALPEDIAKTVIDEIYKRYGEKTVYVGRGIQDTGLFRTKTLSYMVGGVLDKLFIDYKLFLGNGGKSHYFVKQTTKIEITKIII
jgi:hypothetical protein